MVSVRGAFDALSGRSFREVPPARCRVKRLCPQQCRSRQECNPAVPSGDADLGDFGQIALIQQVLANLIENAVFHGGGRIEVSTCSEKGRAVVRVADHGPGVPEAERDKILRRFYRLDQGGSGHTSGAGLGLAMVAAVARAHGGELRLDDNRPGLAVELALPTVS